ncbi:MAG: leucyl aminopeptidase [Chloroflexi bacterium]|nr:leucyl aminopeptidase [Chloroflexota bacterium]
MCQQRGPQRALIGVVIYQEVVTRSTRETVDAGRAILLSSFLTAAHEGMEVSPQETPAHFAFVATKLYPFTLAEYGLTGRAAPDAARGRLAPPHAAGYDERASRSIWAVRMPVDVRRAMSAALGQQEEGAVEVRVVQGDIAQQAVDAIVVNLFEGVQHPGGATGAVDRALGGAITQLIADGDIKGKSGEMTLVHTFGKLPARRVVVAGLGKAERFDLDRVRNLSAEVGRYLKRIGAERAATIVHGAGIGGLDPEAAAQAMTEGALLGTYAFLRHKKLNEDRKEMKELLLVEFAAGKLAALERGAARGRVLAEATNLVRDLANEPSNNLPPIALAEAARQVAEACGLEFLALDRGQMRERGMGGILAVAQGSVNEPRFIVLRYRGNGDGPPDLALVGKGVTFDSGGISIKPAENMGEMKGDMQGGAAVIGAMQAIARLTPRINVLGVIPSAENLPSGSAYRPGDIIRISNGKTVEIINTDAEGRLLLADGLTYARQEGARMLVDIATLTGAASIAVGPFFTGVFGNNQEAIDRVMRVARAAGESFWQLPLTDDYKDLIKGDISDVKQTGPRQGGASTASAFLWEFAEDTPWVHLDIAPTSRSDKDRGYTVKGMTGVTVRTLATLALDLAQKE